MTATGLDLKFLGGLEVSVDGKSRRFRRFPARYTRLSIDELPGDAPQLGAHTRQVAAEAGLAAGELNAILK